MIWIGIAAAGTLLTSCAGQASREGAVATGSATSTPTATKSRAECRAGQLDARFVGGGYATGDDFGAIVIWNPGPNSCQMHGRVGFAGYYDDGSRDSNAGTNLTITNKAITLRSKMPSPRDGQDQSDYLVALMMGLERDDPTQPDGLCRPADEGTPATLVLSVGSVTIRTTNRDPGAEQVSSIYGCHRRVWLGMLSPPAGARRR